MNIENAGMGVLIGMLGGNSESVEAFKKGVGQTIKTVYLADNALHFEFENGYKMKLFDDGQSCCESRYMVCDDDLTKFKGAVLMGAETKTAPNVPWEYGVHEVQFLDVNTSLGTFQACTHNEHNGYYGGFWVVAAAEV